jgi:uncharacterized damage-inducible protein DinB
MAELLNTVADGLASYYEHVAADLHKWADPLSEEQFWRNPFSHGNSVGHLVLHLTGNLSYYIGAQIAGTDYVRNRPREFAETEHPKKEVVLKAFDQAVGMVVDTIRKQTAEDWSAPYTAVGQENTKSRFKILVHCAGHAYHHVGQIIYLSRELTKQT